MRKCQYCQLTFNNQQHAQHVEVCGSRTEVCEGCSKRIVLKNMEEHMSECVQRRTSDGVAASSHTCEHCNTIIPSYDMKEHVVRLIFEIDLRYRPTFF